MGHKFTFILLCTVYFCTYWGIAMLAKHANVKNASESLTYIHLEGGGGGDKI